MEPIPEWGGLMTLAEWKDAVEVGGFIDYDGMGSLATETEVLQGFYIYPSQLKTFEFPEWVSHIVWYNK